MVPQVTAHLADTFSQPWQSVVIDVLYLKLHLQRVIAKVWRADQAVVDGNPALIDYV